MTMRPSLYFSATNSYLTDRLLTWVLQLQSRCPRPSSVYLGDLTLRTNGYRMVQLPTSRWLNSDLQLNTFWSTAQDLTRILASNFNLLLAFTQTCTLFSHTILCSGLWLIFRHTILFELHHLLMRLQSSRARTIKPRCYTKHADRNETGNMRYETLDSCLLFVKTGTTSTLGIWQTYAICRVHYAWQTWGSDGDECGEEFATEGHDYLR